LGQLTALTRYNGEPRSGRTSQTMTIPHWILRLTLAILVMVWMFRQVRKPSGPFGKRVVRAMNLSHAAMTDWALQQVTVAKTSAILDVGCGGGRTVARLAALAPEGKVFGLDYSAASVAVSRATNAREIETGRVQIEQGSVAALPFPDRTFDIVTAVETHYYWPDLPANVRQVLRVLKPGGTFALIAETYRGGPLRLLYGIVMPLLRAAFLSDAEHRDLLTQVGFAEVSTKHLPGKNWICVTGRRPT
jgi:SAM-dependent methyltransferase